MPGQDLAGADSPLSGALGDFDARITALEKGGGQFSPGMVAWTTSDTAPPGWLIADGTAFDTARYAALAVILPSGILPDLRNKFPMGAGDTYALLTTGGGTGATLTAAQCGIPAHTHPAPTITIGSEAAHTHTGTTGTNSVDHTHGFTAASANTGALAPGAGSFDTALPLTTQTAGASANHTHSFTTGAGSSHTHSGSSSTIAANSAANASSPISFLNPYIALTPLIKI